MGRFDFTSKEESITTHDEGTGGKVFSGTYNVGDRLLYNMQERFDSLLEEVDDVFCDLEKIYRQVKFCKKDLKNAKKKLRALIDCEVEGAGEDE